jgi:chromosome segregation ATPase
MANLEGQKKALEAKVKRGREQAGLEGRSIPIANERLMKAKADFKESKESYLRLRELLDSLKQDAKDRKVKWGKMLKKNQNNVSNKFDYYMQHKGFSGKVGFDHDNCALHLTCQVDNQDDTSRTDDVRQLSGGERSYTTLCLLLALGHVVSGSIHRENAFTIFVPP